MKNIYNEIYFFCKKCEQKDFFTDKESGITFLYCSKGGKIYTKKKSCLKLNKHLVKALGLKRNKKNGK